MDFATITLYLNIFSFPNFVWEHTGCQALLDIGEAKLHQHSVPK